MKIEHSSPLYVIGHKNPDTDAVCSAIGNAEYLRCHGYPDALPARCGELPPRTAWVLQQAGVPVPVLIKNATPTAEFICRKEIISVLPDATFLTTYELMQTNGLHTMPVIDEEGLFLGLLGHLDLINLIMPTDMDDVSIRSVATSLHNVANTINAISLTDAPLSIDQEELILLVGASSEPTIKSRLKNYKKTGQIHRLCVICGDRPNVQLYAVEYGVRVLVVTADTYPSSVIREIARETGTHILSTPWDTASVGQLIRCSRRVADVMHTDVISFPASTMLDDLRRTVLKSEQSLFPVLNRKSHKVIGVFSKTDLVDPPRMRLALVDHNELAQAVDGANEAEIIEVMDHHRLGFQMATREPIRFMNEPVGSTSTLVARRFKNRGESPQKRIALCLCAGILSDTINLTSPTTTYHDRMMLEWLCELAEIDRDQFAEELFSHGSLLRGSEENVSGIIYTDRKDFSEQGSLVSLSQVEEVGLTGFYPVREALEKELRTLTDTKNYRIACLLVTDISSHNSLLLVTGDPRVIDNIEYDRIDDTLFSAKGVVSRKKQLFPAISRALKNSD